MNFHDSGKDWHLGEMRTEEHRKSSFTKKPVSVSLFSIFVIYQVRLDKTTKGKKDSPLLNKSTATTANDCDECF